MSSYGSTEDPYLNQPGRAFATAMAWSLATASAFSLVAAVALIPIARFSTQDQHCQAIWLTLSSALLLLGFFNLGLGALVTFGITKMVPRRTVARPPVRLRGRSRR